MSVFLVNSNGCRAEFEHMVAALAWKSRQPFPREWCLVRDPVEREVDEIFDEPECPFHGAGNTGRCNHCEEDEE